MEPKLGLGKAHDGLGFTLHLFVWGGANKKTLLQPYTFYVKVDDTIPAEACGPTREGRTMLSLYSRVEFRWNAVGGGCGGRPVNTGGRCSR
ncbi:unnamed protein product [Sphagnum jensenii]|jgi:hypothetical protein|uniref:Uncharacterized protein n=1 Tax=Sphagnum jensenii TaxID=128206 RepID=A0ABP0WIE8_9BRYO